MKKFWIARDSYGLWLFIQNLQNIFQMEINALVNLIIFDI